MNGTLLKLIALLSMALDHTIKVFPNLLPDFFLTLPGQLTINLTGIIACTGRLSFPIFAFFTAVGSRYTSSRPAYIKRLFLFALLSELSFDLALMGEFSLSSQNVLFTLTLGVLSIHLYEIFIQKHHPLTGFVCALGIVLLGALTQVDYGGFGVLMVFALYLCPGKKSRAGVMLCLISFYYLRRFPAADITLPSFLNWGFPFLFTLLSVPLLWSYNGTRGKGLRYLFYGFYPAHLLLLYFIKLISL